MRQKRYKTKWGWKNAQLPFVSTDKVPLSPHMVLLEVFFTQGDTELINAGWVKTKNVPERNKIYTRLFVFLCVSILPGKKIAKRGRYTGQIN